MLSLGVGITCLSQDSFEIALETDEDCIVWEAAKDNNGSFIGVGIIGTFIGQNYDAFLLKVDAYGNYSTKRFCMYDTICMFSTINVLSDGNYFVIGSYSIENNAQKRDHLWIVILDQELNLLSEKSYKIKEPYVGYGTSACSLIDNDGNIVLAAIAGEEDSKEKTIFADFVFYKFNQLGDTLLSKYYHYIFDEWPYELRHMHNSDNIMLIEKSTHYNGHDELLFLDPDLNILDVNQFGNEDTGISGDLSSDCWVSDTSFLLSGYNSFFTGTYWEPYIGVYLVDTSAVFHHELALNKIDTADYPAKRNSMAYANDSTIYIGGYQTWIDLWTTEPTVAELYVIDKEMNLLGYKELGGDKNFQVWGIIATDDDGCLIYGTKYDNDSVPERDVQIWKVLRDDINIITKLSESKEKVLNVNVYPNPVVDNVNILLQKNSTWDNLTLSIFMLNGKKVFQKQINGSGNLLKANIQNLVSGLYVIQISNFNKIIHSEKVIKK